MITPGNDGSISKNSSESVRRGLDALRRTELLLHGAAVAATTAVSPRKNGAVVQNGSKCLSVGLDLIHILELQRTVTAKVRIAPRDHGSITTKRSEGTKSALNVCHSL